MHKLDPIERLPDGTHTLRECGIEGGSGSLCAYALVQLRCDCVRLRLRGHGCAVRFACYTLPDAQKCGAVEKNRVVHLPSLRFMLCPACKNVRDVP